MVLPDKQYREELKMKNKKIILILIISLVGLGLIFGCTSKEPVVASSSDTTGNNSAQTGDQQTVSTQVTTIGSVYPMVKNWDSDPEADGLEFYLSPKDSKDKLVTTGGALTAKLYATSIMGTKLDLIQEWDSVAVTKDNFDYMGAKIRLEYKNDFTPSQSAIGWLEITFKTSDEKEFSTKNETIFLGS